jgi:hypothetical protein
MKTSAHLDSFAAAALVALVLAGGSLLRPADATAYGWPVKPFDRQHPVRGFFGDPRIDDALHTGSLHFGIDVAAADGTPVYATLTGRVSIHPLHADTVTVSAGGGRVFEYWHVVPTVRSGQWVEAYRTVVGHVEAPWKHVHFSEARGGTYVNPLRGGALAPFVDRTRPEPREIAAERDGRPVAVARLRGSVDLVAEVRDWMPVAAPQPWTGKPVMPALVRWRLRGAAGPVTSWRTAVDFRDALPAGGFHAVYARWTRQNKPWRAGRYRVYLARALDTRGLADGRYRVEVAVADTRGNHGTRTFAIVVRNAPPLGV